MTFNYQETNDEEKCFKQKTINIKKRFSRDDTLVQSARIDVDFQARDR